MASEKEDRMNKQDVQFIIKGLVEENASRVDGQTEKHRKWEHASSLNKVEKNCCFKQAKRNG